MRQTTLRTTAFAASAAVGFAALAVSPAQAQGYGYDEIARLIERIDDARETPSNGNFALQDAPDPTAPTTQIHSLLADLDALPALAQPRAAEAARHFLTALHYRSGVSPDLNATLDAIQSGVAELAAARQPTSQPLQAKLSAISDRAAAVARQIAADVVGLAALGDHRDVAAQARADLVRGDLALRQADPVLAVAFFRGGMNLAADVITFDIHVFERNLLLELDRRATIGYAYSIGRGGQLFSQDKDGNARTAADSSPALPQSPTKEMYVASMSKTLSAVALLKLLNDQGISVDEPITGYLPEGWTPGPDFGEVTFRLLLTHKSGLDSAGVSSGGLQGQSLASLEVIVEAGSTGANIENGSVYTNANFSLMRILVPQIAYGPEVIANFANVWPLDAVYAGLYASYVNANVLMPAGINKTCDPAEGAAARTLLYSMDTPNGNGLDAGNWSLGCGATGWYLSANELGSFLAHLRFTNTIIGPATRKLMDDHFLGWLDPVAFAGSLEGVFGVYRAHGGDFGSDRGMAGCMMSFPINVQATLLINSRDGNLGGAAACALLKEAYDNAWF